MPPDTTGASLPELLRSLHLVLVRLGEQAERLEHEAEHREMLARAGDPLAAPQRQRPKRDRHGLYAVRGLAPLAAGAGWLARSRVHRALAGGLIMATATGATLAPDMMQPAPAAQLPPSPHHAVAHHRHREAAVLPPAVPGVRKRRRLDDDDTVRASAPVSPAASPSPTADPGPSVTPSPSPSVPAPPPAPDPSCTLLHPGKHCHGGDGVSDVARVPGALRGLRG